MRKAVESGEGGGGKAVERSLGRDLRSCRVRRGFLSIKRMDNECDSLGGFHLRIAAFDAGCANAAAGQAINREKGWCEPSEQRSQSLFIPLQDRTGLVINREKGWWDQAVTRAIVLVGFHLRIAVLFMRVVQPYIDGLLHGFGTRKRLRFAIRSVDPTYSYRSHYSFL